MKRPNIIIVTCHDLGDYIPCYGTPVTAPKLEAMAAQGVVFENHFSTATVCSPSRGSIMTGCYPHTDGLMGLVHRGWELDVDNCPALPALLREAGYETHLFGFQHEHWDPGRLGYDHVHRGKGLHCDEVVPLLTEWLRARGEGDQPFLAGVGFSETHRIGLMPSGFKRDAYQPADPSEVRVRPSLPDIPEIREDLADFYGAIRLVDQMMGQLVRTLDDVGLSDSTLLVFTSDHGASFMHAKATLYDGGTKVACLLRWPQALPQGLRVQALTSHVDILPTILDFLGLPVSAHIEGRSFAAAARGQPGPERKYAFSEKTYTNYYDPGRTVRSRSFRYIRKGLRTCIFDFIIPELELCTFDFRRTPEVFRYYSARRCTDELYDLNADPGEIENLVDDPAYKPVLEELSSALDAHLEATNDPFRHLRNDLLMPEEAYESIASVRWG